MKLDDLYYAAFFLEDQSWKNFTVFLCVLFMLIKTNNGIRG